MYSSSSHTRIKSKDGLCVVNCTSPYSMTTPPSVVVHNDFLRKKKKIKKAEAASLLTSCEDGISCSREGNASGVISKLL